MAKIFSLGDYDKEHLSLDINDYLVKNPSASFFMEIETDGPDGSGIKAGDVLVVDRSLQVQANDLAVVTVEGELKLEKIKTPDGITESLLWGVVTGLLRKL